MSTRFIIRALFACFISMGCSKDISSAQPPAEKDEEPAKEAGQILDLTNWKLTLPVNTERNGNPDEIKQPQLNSYKDKWFFVNKSGNAVVFKANTGGETTGGSNFPRSELREMANSGKSPAAWSSSKGRHTLFIDQRVTHLPDVRRHIVIGQIHDADKYVIFFRLEGSKLLVSVNKGDKVVLDEHYSLGTRFNVTFEVENDQTKCYYNGSLKYTYKGGFEGAYFKAGAYVQSSCKGDKKVEGESCEAYGEVEIFDVSVKHELAR